MDQTYGPDTGIIYMTHGAYTWISYIDHTDGKIHGPDIFIRNKNQTYLPDRWTIHMDRIYMAHVTDT